MAQATVILGSGIIGVSTAYYLSQSYPASSIHLIEPSPDLFASASGFAGGFLAADWFSPSVAALGKLSFDEHKRIAEEFGGREKWGYSRSTTLSYTAGRGPQSQQSGRGDDWLRQDSSRANAVVGVSEPIDDDVEQLGPRWLSMADGDNIEAISEEGSTAQVDPRKLCEFLLESCLERGVQLHQPTRAVSVDKDMRDELSSIRILNTETNGIVDLPCTKIVIAAGAWSPQVFSALFPDSKKQLPISSLASHSLVVRSPKWSKEHEDKGCHAIFTSDEEGYSPEVFSRIGGEIYIAGLNNSSLTLPALATDPTIDESAVEQLKNTALRLLGTHAGDLEVIKKGLCFRPVTRRGTPILARIPDIMLGGMATRGAGEGGVWLAAGHGPWGISLSLGSGKVMSDMILGRPTSVNVAALKL